MLNKEQIDKLLEPTIEGLGFEFVCSEIANTNVSADSKSKSRSILRIYIDSEDGVTLDDCAVVSRHVDRVLDVEADIDTKYNLEVSSPGLDRPLIKVAHFERFIGRRAKIKLNIVIEDQISHTMRKNIVGDIKEVKNNMVVVGDVDFPEISYIIDINNISKANLVPEWD